MGIRRKPKRIFVASLFALVVLTGYSLLLKVGVITPNYSSENAETTGKHGEREEREIIADSASVKSQSNMNSQKLTDRKQADANFASEWDMFNSDHVDVAVYSGTTKWTRRKSNYRTVKCNTTSRTISFRSALVNVTAASSADVIIFAGGVGSLKNFHLLKKLRKPHQIWLHTSTESAYQAPPIAQYSIKIDPAFNMSFCYHAKAEVVAPYGAYVQREKGQYDTNGTKITPKPDIPALVAWASSHCEHNFWNRTGFVRDLSKHLPMDLFGGCGDSRIPRNKGGIEVLKNYKFYIAFENTCCSYYITEKFWKALGQYESVPIVIGSSKSEYESVAPPNSFVYADDFDSMEDLANYIKKVGTDETLYNKFHEWRKYGKAEVYTNKLVWPFVEDQNACRLLDYLEKNAWRKDYPLHMKIDLYGPDWAGGCNSCGNHNWMEAYGLESRNFTKRLQSLKLV